MDSGSKKSRIKIFLSRKQNEKKQDVFVLKALSISLFSLFSMMSENMQLKLWIKR